MSSHPPGIFQRARIYRATVALIGAAAAVLFFVTTSEARPPQFGGPAVNSSSFGVTLEDEQGNPLQSFRKSGTTFVLGDVGDRYNVRISNYTGRRVEAVVSIDGRDAISGRVANFATERGYIVPAYGSVLIDGFRKNLAEAAAFRFSSPPDSYSSRMGSPQNVGVVGVAFFPERPLPPRPQPVRPVRPYEPPTDDLYGFDESTSRHSDWGRRKDAEKRAEADRSAPAPSAPPSPTAKGRASASESAGRYRDASPSKEDTRASRLGTEYGESRYSPVNEVTFQRQYAMSPSTVLTLRYDDADGLVARGIDVYPRRYWDEPRAAAPQAFPGNRFAPPPP